MHGGNIYEEKVTHDFSVNINPLGVSRKVKRSCRFMAGAIAQYPDTECRKLKQALSAKYAVKAQNILAGNGASELICAVVRAVNAKKGLIIAPAFSGYKRALNAANAETGYFYLTAEDDFRLTDEKLFLLCKKLKSEKYDIIFLCNPNNPNGTLLEKQTVRTILNACAESGTVAVLDECFMELTGREKSHSFAGELENNPNLVIINALTKSHALPGLRFGYAFCANAKLNEKIAAQLSEWNVSSVAQKTGLVALGEEKYIRRAVCVTCRERSFMDAELQKLGFKVFGSAANFILFYAGIANLKEKLLARQILIRDCSNYAGLQKGFYRVCVKTHRKNKMLVRAIKKILEE